MNDFTHEELLILRAALKEHDNTVYQSLQKISDGSKAWEALYAYHRDEVRPLFDKVCRML